MQIDKQQILDFLRQQGDQPQVEQADRELPPKVDHERDARLLQQLGLDPEVLAKQFRDGDGVGGS